MKVSHAAELGIDMPCAWALLRSGVVGGWVTCDLRSDLEAFIERGDNFPVLVRIGRATVYIPTRVRGRWLHAWNICNFHYINAEVPVHPIGLLVRAAVRSVKMGLYDDYPEEVHPLLDEARGMLPDDPLVTVNGRPLLPSPEALVHLLRLCGEVTSGDCGKCGYAPVCPGPCRAHARRPGENPNLLVEWALAYLRKAGVDVYHVLSTAAARVGPGISRPMVVWMAAHMGYGKRATLHDGNRVYCMLCGRTFATLPQARRHMEGEHGVGDAPVISPLEREGAMEFVEEARFLWCGLETRGPVWRVLRDRTEEERALLLIALRSLWGSPGHPPQVAEIYPAHRAMRSRLREEGLIEVEEGPAGDVVIVATDKLLALLEDEAGRKGRWLR